MKKALQFRRIEILNSSINFIAGDNSAIFNFDINLQHQVDYPNKNIIVIVSVDIKNEDSKSVTGTAVISCIFNLSNFEEVIKADTLGKYQIPQSITESLNSISIGTVRGIMFTLFKGTFLHNAILPIIDLD